jgi:hypothetical protein
MATDSRGPVDGDDVNIAKFLTGQDADANSFLEDIANRPLEVGEKADDAVDYEDISDGDLPDEEFVDDGDGLGQLSGSTVQDMDGGEENDDDLDMELFGGGSSPVQERSQHEGMSAESIERHGTTVAHEDGGKAQPNFRPVDYGAEQDLGEEEDPDWAEQKRLFAQAGAPPPPPETSQEYFDRIWPGFQQGKVPRFFSLIPRKRAFFVPRTPLKPPKPIQLNKTSLDIAADQEKSFRLPSVNATTKAGREFEEEQRGIIYITDGVVKEDESSDEMELDDLDEIYDHEAIGNVLLSDLKIACQDWEVPALDSLSDEEDQWDSPDTVMDGNDWIRDLAAPPTKKRKLGVQSTALQFSVYDHMDLPTWDDPELDTLKLSKKIILDMNDPHLLLDVQQPTAEPLKPRATGLGLKRDNRGSLANPMFKRYNISNDEAYDALKENIQQKIRSTLGHMNVEHSLPALKLQYPFYKVNLSDRELRSFHRPTITFKPGERVIVEAIKTHIKRKHKKNLKPQEAFAVAEDMNVGDTSDLLLAEYSEEYPTTLSNFGMGNKVVNYYRRKDAEDTARPKQELGETWVLLPQDKSPFSIFGSVEPGQTVPTLLNAMYRAPVFQHTPESTDFLVSRSQTGVKGSHYYIRNMQSLVVVGQEFPSVEVPGTHARKVTEASKKRLKMLAFRLYRRGQQRGARQPWVSNEMIKQHLPGTEIAQNRSRMREIMKYEKETGTWRPQEGETIPDEPSLRTWIKPEDVCLIDSMHAGDKHLTDAGFKANDIKDDEAGDEDSIELKLAPWHTTKNFLNACQGKAMLELHGAGDPTNSNEGFSFIKISMKGGFRDIGESVASHLDSKKAKEHGGHAYNVQGQQVKYENAIRRIWNSQSRGLSSTSRHMLDTDMDNDVDTSRNGVRGQTPRSESQAPGLARTEEDNMSQFSRNSGNDTRGKKLRIKRQIQNKHGEYETQVVTITDPEVIKLYIKRKKQEQLENMKIDALQPTGNAEFDAQARLK